MYSVRSGIIIFTFDSIKIDIKWVTECFHPSGCCRLVVSAAISLIYNSAFYEHMLCTNKAH